MLSVFNISWKLDSDNVARLSYFSTKRYVVGAQSGSVVECLTRDREAVGSSLTGVTALWSLSKTHLSLLTTGSTQEDPSLFN